MLGTPVMVFAARKGRGSFAVALVASAWLALWTPALVSAQGDPEQARSLFEKGVSASDAGHWAEAADAFTRSLALVERPSTLFNLAIALHQQGRYREGMKTGTRYLELVPAGQEPENRARIEGLLTTMRDAMGTLALKIEPRDAHVLVDGVALKPEEHASLLLMPGRHAIIVHASDHGSHEETVTVERKVRTLVLVKLTPMQASVPVVTAPQPVAPTFANNQKQVDLRVRLSKLELEVSRAEEARDLANRRKPLILTGIGGALALGGVLSATVSNNDAGPIIGGALVATAGAGILLAGGISGLVRRAKRGYYQRRVDKYNAEIQTIQTELELSVTAGQQSAATSLTLRF